MGNNSPNIACFLSISASKTYEEDIAYVESPAVNDLYVIDNSKLFKDDRKFKYVVAKVIKVESKSITVLAAKKVYEQQLRAYNDVLEEKAWGAGYFSDMTTELDIDKLVKYRREYIISSVHRGKIEQAHQLGRRKASHVIEVPAS